MSYALTSCCIDPQHCAFGQDYKFCPVCTPGAPYRSAAICKHCACSSEHAITCPRVGINGQILQARAAVELVHALGSIRGLGR